MSKDVLTEEQRQNLVATAISAGGRMQFGTIHMTPGAIETFAREILNRATKAFNEVRTQSSSIYTEGRDADGRVTVRGSRSSADPSGDHMLMEGFITLEQAHRIRGVPIAHKLGSLYVVARKPETFDADAADNRDWKAPNAEDPGDAETAPVPTGVGTLTKEGYEGMGFGKPGYGEEGL